MPRTPRAPRVTIDVTGDKIEESTKRDSSHCMIAEAVRSSVPDATRVSVDLQTIRFSNPKKGLRYTYLTPRIAQMALIQFDQGTKPEPFDFRLVGGHVTGSGLSSAKRELTKEERKQRSEAGKKGAKVQRNQRGRARLVDRKESLGSVPDRVGGKTPPTTPFARRRAFGLRGLER